MSFAPITFKYNPPATVVTDIPDQGTVTTTGVVTPSNASTLVARLNTLKDASNYLQSVILSLNANTGVEVNLDANPAFSRAFKAVNGTTSDAPSILPIKIYNNWLDAEVGVSQLQSAAGLNSPIDVNLHTAADLITLNNTIENALLENATYQSQLPLVLRTLKNDSVMFESWAASCNDYPIINNPGSTDVGDDVNTIISTTCDRYQSAYSGLYNVISNVDAVAADIHNLNVFLSNTLPATITRISALLQASKGLVFRDMFTNVSKDIANFAIARISCELGSMVMLADRFAASVIGPIVQDVAQVGNIIRAAQTTAKVASGVFQGLANNGSVDLGSVDTLGQQLSFTLHKTASANVLRQREFQRVIDKRLSVHGLLNQALAIIKSNDSIITALQNVTVALPTGLAVNARPGSVTIAGNGLPPVPANLVNIF